MTGRRGILLFLVLNLSGCALSSFFFPGGARLPSGASAVRQSEPKNVEKVEAVLNGGYRRADSSLFGGRGRDQSGRGRSAAAKVTSTRARSPSPVEVTTTRYTDPPVEVTTARRPQQDTTTFRPIEETTYTIQESVDDLDALADSFKTKGRSQSPSSRRNSLYARQDPRGSQRGSQRESQPPARTLQREPVGVKEQQEVEREDSGILGRIPLRRAEASKGQGRRIVGFGSRAEQAEEVQALAGRVPLGRVESSKEGRRVVSLGDRLQSSEDRAQPSRFLEERLEQQPSSFREERFEEQEDLENEVLGQRLDDQSEAVFRGRVEENRETLNLGEDRNLEIEREEDLQSRARDIIEQSKRLEESREQAAPAFQISQPRSQARETAPLSRSEARYKDQRSRHTVQQNARNSVELKPTQRQAGLLLENPRSRESQNLRSRQAAEQRAETKPSFASRGNARTFSPVNRQRSRQSPEQRSRPADEPKPKRIFASRGNAQTYTPNLLRSKEKERATQPKIQHFDDLQTSNSYLDPIDQDFLPTCPDSSFSYIIPSPSQCDLYYHCELGNPSRKLCEDGLVFSIEEVKCVTPDRENCKNRPLLQTPTGLGPCERANGIFYSEDTCNEFITCRNNQPIYEKCAEGLVFDPIQLTCAWADEALRDGCLPEDLLGFVCPNEKKTLDELADSPVRLRFGDHDRHADVSDCRFFFMCLSTGHPRRAGCGGGKVFDSDSGVCKLAKDVPDCVDYYGPVEEVKVANKRRDPRLESVESDLERQFSAQRSRYRLKRWALNEDAFPEPTY